MDIPMSAKHILCYILQHFVYDFFQEFWKLLLSVVLFSFQEEKNFSQFPETAQSYALVLMAIVKRLYDILLPLAV